LCDYRTLEEKVANDGIIINDAQVTTLEKKKHNVAEKNYWPEYKTVAKIT